MNEFERKLYLKYTNIENMTQLLCLKLYRLRLFIQVNVLLFFYFFQTYFRIAQEEFKQPIKQLQAVPISVLKLNNPSSRQNSRLLIKKSSVNGITFFFCLFTFFFPGKTRKSLDNCFNQKFIIGCILENRFNVSLR